MLFLIADYARSKKIESIFNEEVSRHVLRIVDNHKDIGALIRNLDHTKNNENLIEDIGSRTENMYDSLVVLDTFYRKINKVSANGSSVVSIYHDISRYFNYQLLKDDEDNEQDTSTLNVMNFSKNDINRLVFIQDINDIMLEVFLSDCFSDSDNIKSVDWDINKLDELYLHLENSIEQYFLEELEIDVTLNHSTVIFDWLKNNG